MCPESRYSRAPLNRCPPFPGSSSHSRGAGSISPNRRSLNRIDLTSRAACPGGNDPAEANSISVPKTMSSMRWRYCPPG